MPRKLLIWKIRLGWVARRIMGSGLELRFRAIRRCRRVEKTKRDRVVRIGICNNSYLNRKWIIPLKKGRCPIKFSYHKYSHRYHKYQATAAASHSKSKHSNNSKSSIKCKNSIKWPKCNSSDNRPKCSFRKICLSNSSLNYSSNSATTKRKFKFKANNIKWCCHRASMEIIWTRWIIIQHRARNLRVAHPPRRRTCSLLITWRTGAITPQSNTMTHQSTTSSFEIPIPQPSTGTR